MKTKLAWVFAVLAGCGARVEPDGSMARVDASDVGATTDAATPLDAAVPNDVTVADTVSPRDDGAAVRDAATIWRPAPGTSWQWQLSGTLDTTVDVQVYDIDLFDNATSVFDALHAAGRHAVCYFDLAYEPGRPDSSSFPAAVLGNPVDGWPGERWVDLRSPAIVAIELARLDLAVSKHCDGVELDDIDEFTNNPGFAFTAADQLAFARTMAAAAHARGLSIALKNDLDQVPDLVGDFDFALNEQCFQYSECDGLAPFIAAGKAVFQVEYGAASLATSVCPRANAMNFDTLIKNLDLDAWRVACR